jgi:hypothetical protein
VPGEPAPVPEESTPEVSTPTPDAEQPLSQEESAARSTEEQPPSAEEHLSDQPETVVSESLQVTEQVVREPVPPSTERLPQQPRRSWSCKNPKVFLVRSAPEVDAPAEAPMSNGTGVHHDDPGEEVFFVFPKRASLGFLRRSLITRTRTRSEICNRA